MQPPYPGAPPPPGPGPGFPVPAAHRPQGFFNRNWKWLVPVGCLSLLVAFAGFLVLVLSIVFGAIRSSDVCREAIATASANTEVRSALGDPLETGWLLSGSVQTSGPSGNADLAIPLSGPSGSGKLYVVATKSAGRWHYSTLEVEVEGRPGRIDLLGSP